MMVAMFMKPSGRSSYARLPLGFAAFHRRDERTSGTQEGRIAHHHTDATVLCKQSGKAERHTSWLFLVPILLAKIRISEHNTKQKRDFSSF
jgi:hypothetical protein